MNQGIKINSERLCISIPEMARQLGVSRDFGYAIAKMDGFPVIHLGETQKRMVIPVKALEDWLAANAGKLTATANVG